MNEPVVTVGDTLDGNYLYFDVVPSDIDHVELSSEVPSAPNRISTLFDDTKMSLIITCW